MPDAEGTCICTLSAATASADDSGEWRCEVQNKHGKTSATCNVKVVDESSSDATLAVEKLPEFLETLSNVTTDIKSTVELLCKTDPDKFISVKWFRNDTPIDDTVDRYKMSSLKGAQTLTIIRAKARDSGIFKCRIQNDAGWVSCDAKVIVKEQEDLAQYESRVYEMDKTIGELQRVKDLVGVDSEADSLVSRFADSNALQKFMIKWRLQHPEDCLRFAIHLKSRCVVEGCNTVMCCLVTGEKPYNVKWFKGTDELREGGKYFINEKNGMLSLTINRLKDEDTGNYTCSVRSIQGKIASSCYLQVEPSREVVIEVPTKPYFLTPLKRCTVNEGETIWLSARVKGYPPPGFKWYKDGLELHESGRIQIEMLERTSTAQLVISGATTRDIGLYTCEAHNLAGRCQSMVRVSVRDRLEMELLRKSQGGIDAETGSKTSLESPANGLQNGQTSPSAIVEYMQKLESDRNEQAPVLKTQLPKSIRVDGKSRFLLEFYCAGYPVPTVQWYRNGTLVESSPRFNLLSHGNWFGLEVLKPDPRDSGTYTAKAVNDGGRVASTCEVEMTLPTSNEQELPQIPMETTEKLSMTSIRQVADQQETEGDKFSLAEVVPSFHLCNTEADWTTSIDKEVEVIDADEAPSFPHGLPEHVSPHENDEHVHLECQVRGEPIPRIVWLKNDQELEESENVTVQLDAKTRIASLLIKKASQGDSGHYSCLAYGESGGHATTACDLQVLPVEMTVVDEQCEVSTGKRAAPEFRVELDDNAVEEGSDVKLECVAEGFPVPKVKWFRNEEPIKSTVGKYTVTSSMKGTHSLCIAGVQVSDSDRYTCEAVNECGTATTVGRVLVREGPLKEHQPGDLPYFTTELHSFTFNSGETAMMRCVAKGNPDPRLSWLKDGSALSGDGRIVIDGSREESILTIKGMVPEDAGLYVCCAENDKAKTESSATLRCVDEGKQLPKTDGKVNITVTDETDVTNGTGNTSSVCEEDAVSISGDSAKATHGAESLASDSAKAQTLAVTRDRSREPSVDVTLCPHVVSPPFSQWLGSGEALKLSFEVTKSADLMVHWFHNDKPIDTSRYSMKIEDKIH